MNKKTIYTQCFTQNRELSWLKFNERVLSEADDETVPVLERLKFVEIFTNNLDEFFMIRVGSLMDKMQLDKNHIDNKSGMTPKEQLESIYEAVRPLYLKRKIVFNNIESQLRVHGIYRLSYDELVPDEEKYIKKYFKSEVAPLLSPQIVDSHHPFPFLQNKAIHIGAMLKIKNREVFTVIPIPTALPDIVFLPGNDLRYILMQDIVLHNMERMYEVYEIKEKTVLCVTRNADISTDDEDNDEDFRKQMRAVLVKRRRLAPVRLEISNKISNNFLSYLCENLSLESEQIFISDVPPKLKYVYLLGGKIPKVKEKALSYTSFAPQIPSSVNMNESIIKQIQKKDILLSYPYDSMEPFLQLLKEASTASSVISIKITIYRLAHHSKIVDYLCAAAENGKDVTVLIELRARFDEQNNIECSERLERSGCNIIYGIENYKVHSKLCLITRKERGEIKYITQVGTGNYNEKTTTLYTDFCLMTANRENGFDANEIFKNMAMGNLNGSYYSLLVAPNHLKTEILRMINEEIAKGENGQIRLKLNSITDLDIIERLKQASCVGVKITMIVRGICCILPEIERKTENIKIYSIVGRFLEHSRIYSFGKGSLEKIYISSADFMTRNTCRRVEVACPIYDEDIKNEIRAYFDLQTQDTLKARKINADGLYEKTDKCGRGIDCQQEFMNQAMENSRKPSENKKSDIFSFIRRIFYS